MLEQLHAILPREYEWTVVATSASRMLDIGNWQVTPIFPCKNVLVPRNLNILPETHWSPSSIYTIVPTIWIIYIDSLCIGLVLNYHLVWALSPCLQVESCRVKSNVWSWSDTCSTVHNKSLQFNNIHNSPYCTYLQKKNSNHDASFILSNLSLNIHLKYHAISVAKFLGSYTVYLWANKNFSNI